MISLDFRRPEDVKASLDMAAEVVTTGGVVLIPTESFYGLGADPRSAEAVARILEIKGRPDNLGLPVVCCDWQQIDGLVEIPIKHRAKLSRIWPAALSAVAPCRGSVAAARGQTLAVRIPDCEHLRALLYRVGPLTATSANGHGETPRVSVEEAVSSLHGEPDLVLNAGELNGGRVSTIVNLCSDEARVIRPGAVGWDQPFDFEKWVTSEH